MTIDTYGPWYTWIISRFLPQCSFIDVASWISHMNDHNHFHSSNSIIYPFLFSVSKRHSGTSSPACDLRRAWFYRLRLADVPRYAHVCGCLHRRRVGRARHLDGHGGGGLEAMRSYRSQAHQEASDSPGASQDDRQSMMTVAYQGSVRSSGIVGVRCTIWDAHLLWQVVSIVQVAKRRVMVILHQVFKHMHFLDVIMGSTETHATVECQVTTWIMWSRDVMWPEVQMPICFMSRRVPKSEQGDITWYTQVDVYKHLH